MYAGRDTRRMEVVGQGSVLEVKIDLELIMNELKEFGGEIWLGIGC